MTLPELPQFASDAATFMEQIPASLRKSAFGAIGRLIGAWVGIPEAMAQAKVQRIQDGAALRHMLLPDMAARLRGDDAEMDRLTRATLGEAIIKQSNKDAVAMEAHRLLSGPAEAVSDVSPEDAPSAASVDEPSEDWMNMFVGQAEKASSEGLRQRLGKVLAGEIRKPGSFSPSTVRFVAEVDQPTAQILDALAPRIFSDFLFREEGLDTDLTSLLVLQEAGLLTGVAGTLTKNVLLSATKFNGFADLVEGDGAAVLIWGDDNTTVKVPMYLLTRTGREVVSLLPRTAIPKAAREIANYVAKLPGVTRVRLDTVLRGSAPGATSGVLSEEIPVARAPPAAAMVINPPASA